MKNVIKLTLPAMALVAGAATLPAERDMMGMMKEGEAFFCVGGEGGVTVGSSEVNFESVGAAPVKSAACLGTIGGHGGIFIGAGYAMSNNIFFGIEGNAFWGEAEAKALDFAGATGTLRVQDSYGANLSAGYRMKSACPFVRIGYLASCWELKREKDAVFGNGKKDEYKSAIVFGLGMDMMVAEHVCVGLTWDYAWYGDFSLKTTTGSGAGAAGGTYKVSPQVSFTKLRVKFMF